MTTSTVSMMQCGWAVQLTIYFKDAEQLPEVYFIERISKLKASYDAKVLAETAKLKDESIARIQLHKAVPVTRPERVKQSSRSN